MSAAIRRSPFVQVGGMIASTIVHRSPGKFTGLAATLAAS